MAESCIKLTQYTTLLLLAICVVSQCTEAHSEQDDMRIQLKETNNKVDQLTNLVTKLMETMSESNRDVPSLSKRDKRQAIDSGPGAGMNPFLDGLTLEDLRELVQTECRDGQNGEPGPAGAAGAPGMPGLAGEKGEQGEPGVNGTTGIPGAAGGDGRDGLPGMPGGAGSPGMPGVVGPTGAKGEPGDNGDTGTPGAAGGPGEPGLAGADGTPGAAGERGPQGLPGQGSDARSVYTRWGKKTCQSNATLLYEGIMAGNRWSQSGGGNDFQCLPLNPQSDGIGAPSNNEYSFISGVEFETHRLGSLPYSAHNQNVPCARCYATGSSIMMIPARRDCPDEWNQQYHGYLMSEKSRHPHSSNYVCIDATPDYISGQGHDTNGGTIAFVKPICNGADTLARCPPYSSNRKLLCAVCSK